MSFCKCFRCGKGFESVNPDDVAGDGRCPNCEEKAAKIAKAVDIQLAKQRLGVLPAKSRIRELFTEEQIQKGEIAGSHFLKSRELGINFSPDG